MPTFFSAPRAYITFALSLRGFLKNTLTQDDIQPIILEQVANRESNFLKGLKINVFDYDTSPYLPLFEAANLNYDDVSAMVNKQGLEATLEQLYRAGVYITFEEFKGRIPIRRGELEYQVKDTDFDSRNLSTSLFSRTGGSTGKPSRTKVDLDHLAQIGIRKSLVYSANGVFDAPMIVWGGILPEAGSIARILHHAHMGHTMHRWFSPFVRNDANTGWYYTILTYLFVLMGRLHGKKFPFPQYVPLDDPVLIAQSLADTVQEYGLALFDSTISKCVRVCVAAKEHGIDLTGVKCMGGSEPTTINKVAAIEDSGAKFITYYASSEASTIGLACGNPADVTDVHFMTNNLAMIQHPLQVFDQTVDAFYFTSLLPTNPKFLINVQSDDFGIAEERDCGCYLYQMGFKTHLRQIASYRKMTAEGMTLVGSDMVHILEHVIPERFGGSLLDYQLVEEEDQQGFTKLFLYVDPSLEIRDETALSQALLDAMRNSMPSVRLAQAEYNRGNVIHIRREKPLLTLDGKHFPIKTLKMTF